MFFVLTNVHAIPIAPPTYHTIEALPGDGVFSILRRYQLDAYSCNVKEFYRLNRLKQSDFVIVGKTYMLPIEVHRFNGRTIRSSIGISDFDTALDIQHYNEAMHAAQRREKSFRVDKSLWVPYHILHCPKADRNVPPPLSATPEATTYVNEIGNKVPAGANRTFPIFGKKQQLVPLISNRLKGQVYYVVAGHGGPDPGAIGRRGSYRLCEDEYAYDVALRVCRRLVEHGATAYVINRDPNDGIRDDKFLRCDSDEVLWGGVKMSRSQKTRLTQRSDIINDLYKRHRLQGVVDQRLIAIHVDSRSHGERTDVFFYFKPGDSRGKLLAQGTQRTLKRKYKQYQKHRPYHGSVTSRSLHMLRETNPTGIYVELANIRNKYDQQRLIIARNRQYLADWLFEGVTLPLSK